MNNNQCELCVHRIVCSYKEHYEDVVKLYKKAEKEYLKYPWFKCKIECTQYLKDENIESFHI